MKKYNLQDLVLKIIDVSLHMTIALMVKMMMMTLCDMFSSQKCIEMIKQIQQGIQSSINTLKLAKKNNNQLLNHHTDP